MHLKRRAIASETAETRKMTLATPIRDTNGIETSYITIKMRNTHLFWVNWRVSLRPPASDVPES